MIVTMTSMLHRRHATHAQLPRVTTIAATPRAPPTRVYHRWRVTNAGGGGDWARGKHGQNGA